jgi:hypothetical protein
MEDSLEDIPYLEPGQWLYQRYAAINLRLNNCIDSSWNELDADDKKVWEALEAEVEMLL